MFPVYIYCQLQLLDAFVSVLAVVSHSSWDKIAKDLSFAAWFVVNVLVKEE